MSKKPLFRKDTDKQEQKELNGRLVTTEPIRNIKATLLYGKDALDNLTTRRAIGDKTKVSFHITYTDTDTGRKIPKIMTLLFPTAGLQNDNTTIIKLFSIITGKIAEVPANDDGTPQETRFTFSVHELQKLCGLKSLRAVYDGIDKLKAFLDGMDIFIDDEGNTLTEFEHEPFKIYGKMTLKNAILTVALRKDDKVGILYNYNAVFPLALYALKGTHFIIAQHILTMANQTQQRNSLNKNGYFTISIDNLIKAANLPKHDEKKASERVREPIQETLEEMKEIYPRYQEQGKKSPTYCFDYKILTPLNMEATEQELFTDDLYTTKGQPMREWVKNKIRIYFRGETLNFYKALAQRQSKQIKYNKGK